jgi:O-antigen ligase
MNITFISLLILIVWLPLPYGSNQAWAWALMEIGIFSLALLWLWQYRQGSLQLTPVFYKAIPILVIWLVWLIYITFQLIPLPYSWLQWLSPQAAEVHTTLTTLSVVPHSTAVGLLKSLSYVLLFTLTLLIVNSRSRLRWIALALVLSGLFQALFGSLMTLSGLEYGFFHEKIYNRGLATGTFINRNHMAGYLVMCLSVGIGLLIAQLGQQSHSTTTWRQRFIKLLDWILSEKMRLRIYLVVMVIALVLTRSRMGNTAFFASMTIAGIITLMISKHVNRATAILLVSLIVIDIFIVGAWFGIEKVAQRIEQTSFSTEKRTDVDIYTLEYWPDYLLTGSGLGSYYTTFPRYQGADAEGDWLHAHNDYLEFGVETGLIGVLLLGVAILLTSGVVLIALYRRRQALNIGIAFSVTMAIIALLIHSTVDFNLQIPSNAATFMFILALGWVACYLPTTKQKKNLSRKPVSLPPPSQLVKNVTLSLMAALIYLSYVAGSWGLADLIAGKAQTKMGQWPLREVKEAEWTLTSKISALGLALAPHNPDLLKTMGDVYYWKAIKSSGSGKERLTAYQRALEYFLKAVEQKPTDASIWAQIIQLKHDLRQYDAQFINALEYTTAYGPFHPFAQHMVVDIGLAGWYRFPKNVQSIVMATIERGMQVQAKEIGRLIKERKREWVVCAYGGQKVELMAFCRQFRIHGQ